MITKDKARKQTENKDSYYAERFEKEHAALCRNISNAIDKASRLGHYKVELYVPFNVDSDELINWLEHYEYCASSFPKSSPSMYYIVIVSW